MNVRGDYRRYSEIGKNAFWNVIHDKFFESGEDVATLRPLLAVCGRPAAAAYDPKRTLDERLFSSTHIFNLEYLSDLQHALTPA